MGHSCSEPVWRSSFPLRRAASFPSPMRRRMVRYSHEQLILFMGDSYVKVERRCQSHVMNVYCIEVGH